MRSWAQRWRPHAVAAPAVSGLSLGWIGIANIPSSCFAAAYLPDEGFKAVFTANNNRVTMGGQFFPNGMGDRL